MGDSQTPLNIPKYPEVTSPYFKMFKDFQIDEFCSHIIIFAHLWVIYDNSIMS